MCSICLENVCREAGLLVGWCSCRNEPRKLASSCPSRQCPLSVLSPNVAPDLPLDPFLGSSMAILGPHLPNPYTTPSSEAPPMLPLAPAAGPTA